MSNITEYEKLSKIMLEHRVPDTKFVLVEIPFALKICYVSKDRINYDLLRESGELYGGGSTTLNNIINGVKSNLNKTMARIKELDETMVESDYKEDLKRRALANEIRKQNKYVSQAYWLEKYKEKIQ